MDNNSIMLSRRNMFRAGAGLGLALAATSAELTVAPTTASAADAPAVHGNGFYRFKIGDFQATIISDGYGEVPLGPIFAPNAKKADFEKLLKDNFMGPMIQGTNNVLVVDTGKERILVDTGFGEKLGPSFGHFPGLEANLARAGITPESIDLVVSSHAHLDHIGGHATKEGKIAFPKATFVFVDEEWNYWTGTRFEADVASSPMPDIFKQGTVSAAKDNLPVIKERTKFVKQGGEIVTGVHYIQAPGHSPAHSSILFTSGSDHFLYMGDIAHHPVTSLQHPEYSPVFDYDPAQAIKSRKKILDMAATERLLVMGYHFPFPAIGHVARQGKVYRWVPAQWGWA